MAKFFGFHSSENEAFRREAALFSSEEQHILQQDFAQYGNEQKKVERSVIEKALLKVLQVPHVESLVRRLCDLMTGQVKGTRHITYEGYLHCAAVMVKGMLNEKAGQMLYLARGRTSQGTREDFVEFMKLVLQIYLSLPITQQPLRSWNAASTNFADEDSVQRLAEALTQDLGESADSVCSASQVKNWLSKCHQVAEMHDIISHRIFNLPCGSMAPLIPVCQGIPTRIYPSWLDMGDIVFVNSALPAELRNQWRFLFSSRIHGESFSSLLGNIVDKGPSIIVIKDQAGNIFGGFASTSWNVSPKFTGTDKDFMFSLSPKMAVYTTTGFNDHYHYLNVQQQTLPNGLGMGGQLEYFALWIDAEYGRGKCAPSCTTFGCPQLSATPEFRIDRLEVWAVGPEPVKDDDDDEREARPSILDADVEGKAMLRMLNRGPLSEGLRENPTSDVPEDRSLPPI